MSVLESIIDRGVDAQERLCAPFRSLQSCLPRHSCPAQVRARMERGARITAAEPAEAIAAFIHLSNARRPYRELAEFAYAIHSRLVRRARPMGQEGAFGAIRMLSQPVSCTIYSGCPSMRKISSSCRLIGRFNVSPVGSRRRNHLL